MPLRYLFVDMNAFFASVEQQDDPELRRRPVAVVPVQARTTCCLAVSYEGKRHGVRTGTPVWQAEQLCPDMVFVVGRHERYVEVHHELVRAVGRCAPVDKVLSVDEMSCKLLGEERLPEKAAAIAHAIKAEIRREFDYLTCSIGVGPNVMLAKVAGDMHKPDGLTFIEDRDLPAKLYQLKLTDLPGIGPRMERRLHRYGVTTVRQLLGLTVTGLSTVWGSKVHGERWYYLLRGEDVADKPTRRRTVGHSHVLPPGLRTDDGSRGVLARLIHKAAARLRTVDHWAGHLSVEVRYESGHRWEAGCHLPRCQDTLTLLRAFGDLWQGRPRAGVPLQVGMVLTDLVPTKAATPSLFEEDRRSADLSRVMDRVNRALGPNTVYFGAQFDTTDAAPMRVPFRHIPTPDPAVHAVGRSRYRDTLDQG